MSIEGAGGDVHKSGRFFSKNGVVNKTGPVHLTPPDWYIRYYPELSGLFPDFPVIIGRVKNAGIRRSSQFVVVTITFKLL